MSSGRSRHWDGGLVVSFGTAHSAVLGGIGIQAIQAIQAIRLRAAVTRGPILLSSGLLLHVKEYNARLQTWLKTRQKRLG